MKFRILQGYILVLWGCEVGLLGLGYLALLIGVFTYLPIRGRWSHLEEGGVEVDEHHQSSSSGQPPGPCGDQECCTGHTILTCPHAQHHK